MSLLHRWSLPSRGFFRDLSEGEETSNRSRFTATKIGRQSPRRKANIASVFSTLFERPENHRGMKELRHCSDATDNLPLLVCNENVPPDTNYRDSRSHKCHDIALLEETALRRQSSETGLIPTNSNAGGTTLPAFFIPEPIGEFARQIDEVLNIRSFGLSSIEPISAADPDGFPPLQPISSPGYCQRIRSASSSYPSEGIRSPPPGYRSPDLAPP
ncbi:hypothetical protein SAMD00023353_1801420 [Rosellinia necatrix]|uniref:Uncharacterized protein n=1 Tax=Rosellinia necatrix TaxID=77044 RepID=A0A1S8A8F4_ROSNE|nr:hypothetical protein SAMD00023353_1801420 [Rosellinia necatrix]